MSKRGNLDDAIDDLRCREGTFLNSIGFIRKDGAAGRARDEGSKEAISAWIGQNPDIDAVVWTDLKSNFEKICEKPFSMVAAIAHVQSLDAIAKVKAAEYIWRAPPFVKTPLRQALQTKPWFP